MSYDFASHKTVETKWFEDFQVGEVWNIPSRTQTAAVFSLFAAASGDNQAVHYDVEYCRRHGWEDMLAHGMQTMIQTAAGAGNLAEAMADSLKGALEFGGKALKPIYCGDTIYPRLVVSELVPGRTTGVLTVRAEVYNQHGDLVFEGFHKYLVRKRNPEK